jgi:hypothetical protein
MEVPPSPPCAPGARLGLLLLGVVRLGCGMCRRDFCHLLMFPRLLVRGCGMCRRGDIPSHGSVIHPDGLRDGPVRHEGGVECPRIMSTDVDDLTCKNWLSSPARGA